CCHAGPPQLSTLSPYTTLFRSDQEVWTSGLDPAFLGPYGARQYEQDERTEERSSKRDHGRPVRSSGLDRTGRCTAIAASTTNRADRKSTRLNSSHVKSSYAVFC